MYLGLVLTGTTPLAAHAALTKPFDVRDEISYQDDLDNKPDDDRLPVAISLHGYVGEVEAFLDALRDLHFNGGFDFQPKGSVLERPTAFPCFSGAGTGCNHFAFKLDKTDFRLDLAVKKNGTGDTRPILNDSNRFARAYFSSEANVVGDKIVADPIAHTDNDQIFVITHLPRAGLDPLLVRDAK